MSLPFAPSSVAEIARRIGGDVLGDGAARVHAIASVDSARGGELAPLLSTRYLLAATEALSRGASLLVARELAGRVASALQSPLEDAALARALIVHESASWALAELLDGCSVSSEQPRIGRNVVVGENVVIAPRVVIGDDVVIGDGSVIGRPGFGWAERTHAGRREVRRIPQLGGVVIESGAEIGPLSTIDAGTLAPTRIGRGVKLDAQVHVGHNVVIGDDSIVAAQSGFAGSVVIGRGVLIGGQVGIADHCTIGDGARIAAKSGVIGDVPAGAVVAGYPAVPRARWLRALARLYREIRPEPRTEIP